MQAKETAAGKKPASGDDSINFRPSPNFKHMKKYLKSKFEEMSSIQAKAEAEKVEVERVKPEPVAQVVQAEEKPKEKPKEKAKPPPPPPPPPPAVQPPLPPNPPPPDSPPVTIKQEIFDDDYAQYMTAAAMGGMEDSMPQYTTEMPQVATKGAEVTMCRNFVRGTCTKGPACIFVHELILDQLPGVYTFCRNFQNRQCTFARCKFVHATVFEKEYFYRTGYLPPHTLAHLKAQPPPPPPPPEEPAVTEAQPQTELPAQDMAQAYYAAQPMDMSYSDSSMAAMQIANMSCAAMPTYMLQSPLTSANEQQDMYSADATALASLSPTKRDWAAMTASALDEVAYAPLQPEMIPPEELIMKKCKDCDTNEFRIPNSTSWIDVHASHATKVRRAALRQRDLRVNAGSLRYVPIQQE